MPTLVIETATAACSVALLRGTEVIASGHEVVGRGHAERLVPMIAALPDQGRAPRILVDVGPGSFTGVRVGLAAALGLAIGWGAEVHGYSSLALLAAAGSAASPQSTALAAILEGGHGEVFMQSFTASPLMPEGPLQSLIPAAALAALGGRVAIGSGVRHLVALDSALEPSDALPRAEDVRLLPPALASLPPRPIYGRAPDAKTLAERGLA
ncbi:tRNA (adenosine(37)-N6)-threonylcarbamoyltransferase complex dimerization subunit type 1 TsaB [Sphingomonas psychrotolerans]|uniref:tRNA (Adenosine(37)-N6)-threonylcarbamoyltransferase complex dimerization subunit type 1 TsaB n=1 Tax=Sphingomonas psychrotolerans TaxID=1327635 RepID=A0ABU3N6N6_9SPHN|nr:tRNA (adenosine(37)-N6)-threonylcarbamoyltransferase complex dimerization subunit type 1 TsaB [Sphingomonas psychrotolerans]MDT8759121.1 tRNA (adenosine(37)-N6)-threonylcarbamoyltransferase complex dimerization subunit type 1 TsaB [Sphingomonas psychrotolerans]